MFAKPQWGIYLNGVAALVPDNIIAVDFKNDWRIADYPQEEGAFQSYNKVLTPYDVKVTMTKGGAGLLSAIGIGSSANVKSFIAAVEMAAASLNLYDVMTPDRTYHSANITHYDYKRSAENGVSLLTVELWLQQIRVTATTAFTNTAAPDGMDPANTGSVQATTPTPAQAASAPETPTQAAAAAQTTTPTNSLATSTNAQGDTFQQTNTPTPGQDAQVEFTQATPQPTNGEWGPVHSGFLNGSKPPA
jgi:hypothetical protein